jgi:putative ABC transport system permease protein
VNRTFVRRYLADQEAIGRRLKVGPSSLEIVGIVTDVHLLGLDSDPKPELFTSYQHAKKVLGTGPMRLTLAIRTVGDPSILVPFLRRQAQKLDPELALEDLGTMNSRLTAFVAQPRFYALLLCAFAGMALVLASAGLYGVLSHFVARQTQAIGVRRALGARAQVILALVLGKGGALVLTGLAIGMVVSFGATRMLAHLVSEATTNDPLSSVVAALVLLVAGFFACYVPARRATRIDPIEALRHDR